MGSWVIVEQKGGGGSNLNYGMLNKVVISINVPSPVLMLLRPSLTLLLGNLNICVKNKRVGWADP